MSVGFKLRPNTYSRMSHLPAPYIINEAGQPDPSQPPAVFNQQVQLRYGKPLDPWLPFDSAPGLHEPEFEYFLSNIATKNPGWFAANNYGTATGDTTASFLEAHDCWYGQGPYADVSAESKRLDGEVPPVDPPPPTTCKATATSLCLQKSRFSVSVDWKDHQGRIGAGQAVGMTPDTGYFWFFDKANVELVVKVLDGRSLNNKFWVFYGALSDVEYTITVTDVQTGAINEYHNPSGTMASVGDTSAFPG